MTELPSWATYFQYAKDSEPSQEDLDFFSNIDWLQPYTQKDGLCRPITFFARLYKGDSTDFYFNKTIKTRDTIPHALGFVRKGNDLKDRLSEFTKGIPPPASPERAKSDYTLIVDLATGLSGFADTAHGGVLGALFDEAMGSCVELFRQSITPTDTMLFTANLNVSYLAPVPLPGIYLIHVWVDHQEGRKWVLKSELVGKDGVAKAKGETLWISTKTKASL